MNRIDMTCLKTIIRNLVSIVLIFCIIAGLVSCEEETPRIEQITTEFFKAIDTGNYVILPEDFIYQARANPDLFILDLREPEEYSKGHVRYALNIPWGMDLWANIDKIPYTKPVAIYGDCEYLSMQAAALLALSGYQVKSVSAVWKEICLVEGVGNVIETGTNRFNQVPPPDIDPDLRVAIEEYFKRMEILDRSMMDEFTVNLEDAVFMLENNEEDKAFLCVDPDYMDETPFKAASVNIPFGSEMILSFKNLQFEQYILVYGTNIQEVVFTTVWLQVLGFDAVMIQL